MFLLKSLQEEDLLKEFAVFCKIKSLYSNSCIYNYSYRTLHYKTGISINLLKKCIPFFIASGWCYVHNGNLIFNKISSIDENRKKVLLQFKINKGESYKDLLKRIKLLFVRVVYNQFEYIKKVSRDYIEPSNLKAYKAARKAVRNFGIKPIGESEKFKMSNRKIGYLILRSKSTASRLMKYGKEKGILDIQKRIERARGEGMFMCNGVRLVQRANYIIF